MNGAASRMLLGLADDAERFVRARLDRLVTRARREADELGERAGERIAGVATAVGTVLIAVGLLAGGLAGALGEALGSAWLGQLVSGTVILLAALAGVGLHRARSRRRRERESIQAAHADSEASARERDAHEAAKGPAEAMSRGFVDAGTEVLRRHPIAGITAMGAAGVLAGSLLVQSNGRGHGARFPRTRGPDASDPQP